MKKTLVLLAVVAGMLSAWATMACANEIWVETPVTSTTINAAIASAQPGDCVIIPNGTYSSLNQIVVPGDVDGTEANPITLKAATAGGVTFTGDSASPLIFIQGDWWIIRDFKFIDVSEVGDFHTYGIYTRDATGTRITNNYFEGLGVLTDTDKYSWCIWIGHRGTGHYSRVDHNTFVENEAVHININAQATHCQVDHNYLKNSLKDGSNGFEGVVAGGDSDLHKDIYTIVEYNLFENMAAEHETISNKSSSNTYRYNVFKSTGGALAHGIVLRGGDDCIIDGNYFLDVDKFNIRVHGTGHKIINNYFENPGYSAIQLAEGSTHYADVVDISILNNTIVNPENIGIHIGKWWPDGETKPKDLTFKNNIMISNVSGSRLVKDSGHTGTFTWTNNLHYATGGAFYWINDGGGGEPASGITYANPNLIQGTYIQRLQASSANAIENGTPDANVTDDIDGHSRDAINPDIGCDEYSASAPIRTPVTEDEVGPDWMRDPPLPTCQNQGYHCCYSCLAEHYPEYDCDCAGLMCCQSCVPLLTIPQDEWSLLWVDSEEMGDVDRPATNSFDGDPCTIWHTEWSSPTPDPCHPHEIQIDLGGFYDVCGFRYLPRQDDNENGMIKDYEFYVSDDPCDWGSAVVSGTFANDKTEKTVSFDRVLGRYVRLRALSEINDGPWTSMAELNVLAVQPDSDINNDGKVNLEDFAVLATWWDNENACSSPGWCGGADFDMNGTVDFTDLTYFVENWLRQAD